MSNIVLDFFANFIEKELGIVYSADNYFQLQNRLEEIVTLRKLKDIDTLLLLVQQGSDIFLKQLILDIATNNETSFYRDARVFTGFRQFLVPQILQQKPPTRPFRIWSAACSAGQEPYSLAMICHELKTSHPSLEFDIFATDISERILKKAHAAKYTDLEVHRGLPSCLLEQHFKKTPDDQWQLNEKIRSMVKTAKFNLLGPMHGYGKFDVIFCRNVLIYQKIEAKTEIIKRLIHQIEPGGFLVMGAGESMLGISEGFEQHEYQNTIFYQIKNPLLKVA